LSSPVTKDYVKKMNRRWNPVVDDLRERFAADTDVVELEAYLSSQGYDRRQIGEILSLLYSDTDSRSIGRPLDIREQPLRVQGPHERGRFTADAWGYLIALAAGGALNLLEFEQLVERALVHVDGRIGLVEIRTIAEEAGFDAPSGGNDRSLLH
jgi:Smg protein